MLGKFHHFGRKLQQWDLIEIFFLRADLLRKAQRDAAKSPCHRFHQKRALTGGKNDAREACDFLPGHCVPDDCECLLADVTARRDIVRFLEIPGVNLPRGYEPFDLDRARNVRASERCLFIIPIIIAGGRGGGLAPFLVRSGRWLGAGCRV